MKRLNNTVIKNLSPQMGERIIEKYQSDGWDTSGWNGRNYFGMEAYHEFAESCYYYGVIDGKFGCCSAKAIEGDYNDRVSIIELDEWRFQGVSDIDEYQSRCNC